MKFEAIHVDCGYSKRARSLTDVNFTLEGGEVCCILGPNGIGKTTLFKTILGDLPPLAGQLLFDGKDMTKFDASELARHVAYVSQSHEQPFPYLVEDVVMLGRVNELGLGGVPTVYDRRIVDDAIEAMGIRHLRKRPYTDISGGELQLTMIARALAQQPQMLVLDEPTAALDYGNVVRVIDVINQIAEQGYGVLFTTHSPDHAFLTGANVVLLRRGEPPLFGPANDVVTGSNLRSTYGVRAAIVEFEQQDGSVMRMTAPEV